MGGPFTVVVLLYGRPRQQRVRLRLRLLCALGSSRNEFLLFLLLWRALAFSVPGLSAKALKGWHRGARDRRSCRHNWPRHAHPLWLGRLAMKLPNHSVNRTSASLRAALAGYVQRRSPNPQASFNNHCISLSLALSISPR